MSGKLMRILAAVIILMGLMLAGCPNTADKPDVSAKSIKVFNFTNPAATGVISEADYTIAVIVPFGTNVRTLVPSITHSGASISPASGAAQDFTDPVTYTVTAEDSSTQTYNVTVTIAPNTAKAITSFSFTNPPAVGNINESDHTITVKVPCGTIVTSLVPTITNTGASISPVSGSPQDFTGSVTYTVTAADNSTQAYIVTVMIADQAVLSSSIGSKLNDFNLDALINEDPAFIDNRTGNCTVSPASPWLKKRGECITYNCSFSPIYNFATGWGTYKSGSIVMDPLRVVSLGKVSGGLSLHLAAGNDDNTTSFYLPLKQIRTIDSGCLGESSITTDGYISADYIAIDAELSIDSSGSVTIIAVTDITITYDNIFIFVYPIGETAMDEMIPDIVSWVSSWIAIYSRNSIDNYIESDVSPIIKTFINEWGW
jgi:hypothetical protein